MKTIQSRRNGMGAAKMVLALATVSYCVPTQAAHFYVQGLERTPQMAAAFKAELFERLASGTSVHNETSFAAFPIKIENPAVQLQQRIRQDQEITGHTGEVATAIDTANSYTTTNTIFQDRATIEAELQTVAPLQIEPCPEDRIIEDRAITETPWPAFEPIKNITAEQ